MAVQPPSVFKLSPVISDAPAPARNSTDDNRIGLIVHYSLAWLRQEENQYIGTPNEVLKSLPEDLLRLMGYSKGAYSLGFYDAGRDPIAAVRPELEREADVMPELNLQSSD